MKASQIAKKHGNRSLSQVGQVTGTPDRTLQDMAKNYPKRFEALCIGAAILKKGVDKFVTDKVRENVGKYIGGNNPED
jgi:hypothetical protein